MTLENRQVLVTGGTGFTGSLLVKKLCALGARVTVIARSSSRLGELEQLPVRWVRGDVFDPEVIRQAAAGMEYIFHVAAAYREAKIEDITYYRVHVESTRLLAQAALQQPDFKRFIHVSTVGVHGHIEHPPANEETPLAPGDVYQRTKAEAETWLWGFARQHELPVTVIRPAAIMGPGDKRLLKLFKLAKSPVVPLLGFGKCLYHLIHVEDLTDCMLLAATHPAAVGEAFICGNETPMGLRDMVRVIAREYGRQPTFVRVPAGPFFLLGTLCEWVCRPLGIEPPIYRRRVAFFTKDRAFDTRKLRDKLAFQYRYTNESGVRETARWYREANWL